MILLVLYLRPCTKDDSRKRRTSRVETEKMVHLELLSFCVHEICVTSSTDTRAHPILIIRLVL